MTNEEAYKILTTKSPYVECKDCDNLCGDCELYNAQEVAVKVLEKQIQQKAVNHYNAAHIKTLFGYCPDCNMAVNNDMEYCYECGRKLDWSE